MPSIEHIFGVSNLPEMMAEMMESITERVLRERWDIARGIYDRAICGVARPTVLGKLDFKLDYIEVRVEG